MNLPDLSHGIGDLSGHMGGMGANGPFEAQLSKPNHFEPPVLGDQHLNSFMPPNGMTNQNSFMGGPTELHPHRPMDDPSMIGNFHYDNNILHQDSIQLKENFHCLGYPGNVEFQDKKQFGNYKFYCFYL